MRPKVPFTKRSNCPRILARRGVPWYLLRSVLKALSWLCILAGESLGMACRRFLDMTARKIR